MNVSHLAGRAAIVGATGALVLSGCGGSGSTTSSSGSTGSSAKPKPNSISTKVVIPTGASAATITADPSGKLAFVSSKVSAKGPHVAITFVNQSSVKHNIVIGSGGAVLAATPTFSGGKQMLILSLRAGTYEFHCSVPGHRQAGMQGTLTVT